ncbi:MAG: TrbG/VirB9 family P-type conjugative transfer protein [Acidobacteriota bacterium]
MKSFVLALALATPGLFTALPLEAVPLGREVPIQGPWIRAVYGQAEPVEVRCAPLRLCGVLLGEGERVLSIGLGDDHRWSYERGYAGRGGDQEMVFVRPSGCDQTTNLLMTTDAGRIYDLRLVALPCGGRDRAGRNPELDHRSVVFTFPQAVETWTTRAEAEARVPEPPEPSPAPRFVYTWTKRWRFPVAPLAIYHDERATYLHWPERLGNGELPVLFGLSDGEREVVNYEVREGGTVFVVDHVMTAGELVLGDPGKRRPSRSLRFGLRGDG